MAALTESSGAVTVSGLVSVNALPVNVHGSGDVTPLNSFTGPDGNKSLNVNLSGGTISVAVNPFGLQSGNMVIISGGPAGLSGLNVNASVTSVPPALQSGTQVLISGGQSAISGVYAVVSTSGLSVVVVGLSGGGALATANTNGDNYGGGNSIATMGYGFNGSTYDRLRTINAVSGGARSGMGILVAGALGFDYSGSTLYPLATGASGSAVLAVSVVSGPTVTLSVFPFGIQSGTMVLVSGGQTALSGLIVEVSGETVATSVSGNSVSTSVSGNTIVAASGSTVRIITASGNFVGDNNSGALNVWTVSGDLLAVISGGTLPVSIVSGSTAALSGLVVETSGNLTPVSSGGTIPVAIVSGLTGSTTYHIYFSGVASQSGPGGGNAAIRPFIGFYNPGPLVCEVVSFYGNVLANTSVGAGNILLVHVSGILVSGNAQVPIRYDSLDAASQVSGWIGSATNLISGISTSGAGTSGPAIDVLMYAPTDFLAIPGQTVGKRPTIESGHSAGVMLEAASGFVSLNIRGGISWIER